MPGKLTTHILDTAHGQPAAEVKLELWQIDSPTQKSLLKQTQTNSDGRTDEPLLMDSEFQAGCYELIFAVGDYFSCLPTALPQPPFLDHIPIRFHINDADAHYHIPLLVSPWSYSTYRGS
jgi:5-hydroxyisourate hydrolase